MFTAFSRIIRYGFKNFFRNGWLSVATVAVMLLALSFLLSLIVFRHITLTSMDTIKDKIDISVFFKISTSEDEILRIKKSLEGIEQVKSVSYLSREDALDEFKKRHQNDVVAEALSELDDNPLLASINIKAKDPSDYQAISSYLDNDSFSQVIQKITFAENKLVIERLTSIIESVNKVGLAITIILAIVAILVAFNTIWLAMYSNREEISIMRLVGASNAYIRGPYIIEGVIYGIASSILSIIIAIPVIIIADPWIGKISPGLDLKLYFFSNIIGLSGYQLSFGVALGAISSFIAIRRYLKV